MGDLGGLIEALSLIGKVFLKPFTSFRLQSFLLSSLFRMLPNQAKIKVDEQKLDASVKKSPFNNLRQSKFDPKLSKFT